jgi:hypothetical protein
MFRPQPEYDPRQAESYYVDSNMFLNLPEKVGFVFTSTELPRATKMFQVQVKKRKHRTSFI